MARHTHERRTNSVPINSTRYNVFAIIVHAGIPGLCRATMLVDDEISLFSVTDENETHSNGYPDSRRQNYWRNCKQAACYSACDAYGDANSTSVDAAYAFER